ncbi:MAG: ABC transporter permease, partial [Anaerolineales bacterium]
AIAINLLMFELTMFFLQTIFNVTGTFSDPSIMALPPIHIPVLREMPVLGDILSGYNFIVYFSWLAVPGCYILLFRTRLGRHIRATGENIEAAQTAGINVDRVRMGTILTSGALAGMAGAYLSVGHLTLFTHGMSAGRGWTGLTAALFGMNHPIGAFLTSLFFGAADAFALRLQGVSELPGSLVLMLPHLLTVIAITVVGLRGRLAETLGRRRFRARATELLAQAQGATMSPGPSSGASGELDGADG